MKTVYPVLMKEDSNHEYVVYIPDMDGYTDRKKIRNLSVKKNCSIPQWLAERAEAAGINFSRVLQDALMDVLGIKDQI